MSLEHAKSELESTENVRDALRAELKHAPVFAFLKKFDQFTKKKQKVLSKNEVLFEPGENPYLYIVASGGLDIFKINSGLEAKEVGKVYTGECIGEGVLTGRTLKEVRAVSITERTIIIALSAADMEYLESQDPTTLASFYKHINDITSLRLSQVGKELAHMYEATQKFQQYRELGGPGLLSAINHLKKSLDLDSILMIEEHPFVAGLMVYKYNTQFPSVWPLNQKVEPGTPFIKWVFTEPISTLRSGHDAYCSPLMLGEKALGYLIVTAKADKKVTDTDVRLLEHLSPMVASMLFAVQVAADIRARWLANTA